MNDRQEPSDNSQATVVRRKSSIRKGRTSVVEHVARQPAQARSKERFERILAAAEELLQTAHIEDISFYDIARQADISPASINYIFPTMAALRIELSKRYLYVTGEVAANVHRGLAKERNPSWQTWIYNMGKLMRDYYNSHRHASEVVFGPHLHREARIANIFENDRGGQELLDSFSRVFIVPSIPGLAEKFALAYEIADVLWSRSYISDGFINEDMFEESIRIQIAYLRTVLPETLSLIAGAPEGAETQG